MKKQGLPNFELEAMMIIWEASDPISTSEILRQMETQCRLQALQSILKRMEKKGFIRLEKIGHINYFTPLIKQEDYTVQETMSFIDRLYNASPVQLVASLVKKGNIKDSELEELQKIIDDAKKKKNL